MVVLRRRRSFAFLYTYNSGIAIGARGHGNLPILVCLLQCIVSYR